jgi:hypothetical protein
VTSGTTTKAHINTVVADSNSWYDATTNYRYTPQTAGKYRVSASAGCGGTFANYCIAYIYKNGAAYAENGNRYSGNNSYAFTDVSVIVPMNGTTDYLETFVYVNVTGTATIIGGSAPLATWFEAVYIAP